jgi:flavin reductase (DIM6/NTAB) family NADH-FMN oxidoreductase RutF
VTSPRDIVGPVPPGQDPEAYDRLRRRVLWAMPSGLYVVGTRVGARRNLMTISWVTQVAMRPKLVGIGVESGAVTHALLTEGGVFALNLLPRAERPLVRRFAKPVTEVSIDETTGVGTMQGHAVHCATTGAPILDVAWAWLDCEVRHHFHLGSHSWFVGEVVDSGSAGASDAGGDGSGAGGQGVRDAGGEVGGDTERVALLRMEDTRMNYGG